MLCDAGHSVYTQMHACTHAYLYGVEIGLLQAGVYRGDRAYYFAVS